jgi:hypothetical protein
MMNFIKWYTTKFQLVIISCAVILGFVLVNLPYIAADYEGLTQLWINLFLALIQAVTVFKAIQWREEEKTGKSR